MRQVKGSMFIMFVKAIKADKKGTFDKFLTDKDREVLSKLILSSGWYPFETYKNCFLGVSQVIAGNNAKTLKDWGRMYGEESITTIYKSVLLKKDPRAAMEEYQRIFKNQFDFGRMEATMISDNEMTVAVKDFDKEFEPWYYVAQGWVERVIQLVIQKPVRSEIMERSWAGAPATVFRFNW
jgi:hypothetical protein